MLKSWGVGWAGGWLVVGSGLQELSVSPSPLFGVFRVRGLRFFFVFWGFRWGLRGLRTKAFETKLMVTSGKTTYRT